MLLGNTSWRIRRVQAGSVLVEDAQGAAPTIPFWRSEAPARTDELSTHVAVLRKEINSFVSGRVSDPVGKFPPEASPAISWLKIECGLDDAAPTGSQYRSLRVVRSWEVPTQATVIAERFSMKRGCNLSSTFLWRAHQQSLGSRARKRFCRSFNLSRKLPQPTMD
jgi:ATP-dependent Lhr-like helicase